MQCWPWEVRWQRGVSLFAPQRGQMFWCRLTVCMAMMYTAHVNIDRR
jgi:hypothetical protein